jgi:predicted sugar kinase
MAVAKALAVHHEADDERTVTLAGQIGRGQRSAVGITGFETGGLVVDMGDSGDGEVFDVAVPASWRFVLISPAALSGINGRAEERAFRTLRHLNDDPSEELKEMVTGGLLPPLAEGAIEAFGEALFILQQRVGASYASVQGGVYADPLLARIVDFVRGCGVSGVGQSSWGPTLYAVVDGEVAGRALAAQIRGEFGLNATEVSVVSVSENGARVTVDSDQGASKAPRVGLA